MTTTAPAASPDPNTGASSLDSSPAVQELHPKTTGQSGISTLEMQRQLLQQKLAEKKEFTSPTDQMMTPCSKKLQDHKKKAFGKAKPSSLSSRFGAALAEKKAAAAASSSNSNSNSLFGEPTKQ